MERVSVDASDRCSESSWETVESESGMDHGHEADQYKSSTSSSGEEDSRSSAESESSPDELTEDEATYDGTLPISVRLFMWRRANRARESEASESLDEEIVTARSGRPSERRPPLPSLIEEICQLDCMHNFLPDLLRRTSRLLRRQ